MMQTYDLFLPIGPDCRVALYLQRFGLRYCAFPLDWQLDYSLGTVLHLLQSGFKDFFREIEYKGIEEVSGKIRVLDKRNCITNIHHFPPDDDLSYTHQKFLILMRKRWNKLNEMLNNMNDCCLMMNRKESILKMQQFLLDFSMIYPNLTVNLVNMNFDNHKEYDDICEKTIIVNDNLSITEYSFNNDFNSKTGEKFIWPGNDMAWQHIMCKYDLRSRYTFIERNFMDKKVVIYGAGKRCEELLRIIGILGVNILGIAVTETEENPAYVLGYPVHKIDHYELNNTIIISMANKDYICETVDMLLKKGYYNIFLYNQYKQFVSAVTN